MTAATRVVAAPDLHNVIDLLFGGPFLGIALMMASTFFHGWLRNGLVDLGLLILIVYVMRGKGMPFGKAILILAGWALVFLFFGGLAVRGLSVLASGGAFENDRSGQASVSAQDCVTVFIIWLVIGVPNRAFRIRLDPNGEGHAQAALLGLLAWTAAVLTGAYILMLHFAGGPLRSVTSASLVVGVIFTVVLAMPVYRFMAGACWKYGIRGMFSPGRTIERWRKMLPELQAARDRASAPDAERDPKVEPADPRADAGGQSAASAAPPNHANAQTAAATTADVKAVRTSSRRTTDGKAARRAGQEASKADGTAGS
jgi:hypothetical protein